MNVDLVIMCNVKGDTPHSFHTHTSLAVRQIKAYI